MCTRRFVVARNMLGNREQSWSCWTGKEVVEMTSKEVAASLKKGDEILGLSIGKDGEL